MPSHLAPHGSSHLAPHGSSHLAPHGSSHLAPHGAAPTPPLQPEGGTASDQPAPYDHDEWAEILTLWQGEEA